MACELRNNVGTYIVSIPPCSAAVEFWVQMPFACVWIFRHLLICWIHWHLNEKCTNFPKVLELPLASVGLLLGLSWTWMRENGVAKAWDINFGNHLRSPDFCEGNLGHFVGWAWDHRSRSLTVWFSSGSTVAPVKLSWASLQALEMWKE